ncbi:MAG: extracellular solute-binding protein [Geminicoccaceae bacterium]
MTRTRSKMIAGVSAIAVAQMLSAGASAADLDCADTSIKIGAMTPPFIGGPAIAHGETWEGDADVATFPFGELYTKFLTPMATNQYAFDVILHAPAWHGDFAPFLAEIPDQFKEGVGWDDIHPTYRERLMFWDGRHISVTIDGDVHTGTYRTDLFGDADEQAAFKEQYGYDLAPPETWDQYYDIAEFFTRPDEELYGTAEAFVRGGQQFWFFFSHAAAYTNHPDNPGSMFFDPETMDAQINNPGWLRGLEDYIRSVEYSPPGALNYNSGDIRTTFASGSVAMNFDWGDTGTIAADPEQSNVAGNVGFYILPGSTEIWNHKTESWDEFDEVVHSPFMAYGGWVASVPTASENVECAWDYVMHYTSMDNSAQDVVTGGTGINPYRISHFENVDNWLNVFDEATAQNYLEVQRGSIEAENVALDLRVPGFAQYTEVLEIELSKALSGDTEPQVALDAIAEEWNRITDELGRDSQLAIYRASMGLPPL